jgi:ABC-2 type transport system permease protein
MNTAVARAESSSISPWQQYVWSLRREFWENRALYLAPVAAAALFLVGFIFHVPAQLQALRETEFAKMHGVLTSPYDMGGALAMLIAMVVSVFYTLDALYGERRDRTILFWKSMPVSDTTTVVAKATIPTVILPLLAFAIVFVMQLIMVLMTVIGLAVAGQDVAKFWGHLAFFRMSWLLLYHMVMGHALWYAPLYAWLLLISAWAKRTPIVWAFAPPIALCYLEKIAFGTRHLLDWLLYRLMGSGMEAVYVKGSMPMNPDTHLTPLRYMTSVGLWNGLIFTVACVWLAAWLRRHRDPS